MSEGHDLGACLWKDLIKWAWTVHLKILYHCLQSAKFTGISHHASLG